MAAESNPLYRAYVVLAGTLGPYQPGDHLPARELSAATAERLIDAGTIAPVEPDERPADVYAAHMGEPSPCHCDACTVPALNPAAPEPADEPQAISAWPAVVDAADEHDDDEADA